MTQTKELIELKNQLLHELIALNTKLFNEGSITAEERSDLESKINDLGKLRDNNQIIALKTKLTEIVDKIKDSKIYPVTCVLYAIAGVALIFLLCCIEFMFFPIPLLIDMACMSTPRGMPPIIYTFCRASKECFDCAQECAGFGASRSVQDFKTLLDKIDTNLDTEANDLPHSRVL